MKYKILMIPGPTKVSIEVLAKLALPVQPHYGDEFVKLYSKVHSDTSTGVENPIEEICDIASERGILTIIDSVSGLGGTSFSVDKWKIDPALSGSQKCLEAPAGLSFLSTSEKAWQRFRN